MALHGCMRFMKYLVFVFNFIVWLIGMMVLGIGVWLRLDPKTSQFINAADGLEMYYIGTYILIGAGGLMTIVGFVGCCGAFQESACMLGTYFAFLFLILCAEITAGVLAFLYSEKITSSITKGLKESVQQDYGNVIGRTNSINFLQRTLSCCGGEDPHDYINSEWYKNNHGRMPKTCCDWSYVNDLKDICEMTGMMGDTITPAAHQKGCGPKLIEFFEDHLHIMIGASLGIAAVEILGMIFSIVLSSALCRHGGYRYRKAN